MALGQASCGDQYRSWPLDPRSYPYPKDLKVFWGSLVVVLLRWIFFGAAVNPDPCVSDVSDMARLFFCPSNIFRFVD